MTYAIAHVLHSLMILAVLEFYLDRCRLAFASPLVFGPRCLHLYHLPSMLNTLLGIDLILELLQLSCWFIGTIIQKTLLISVTLLAILCLD